MSNTLNRSSMVDLWFDSSPALKLRFPVDKDTYSKRICGSERGSVKLARGAINSHEIQILHPIYNGSKRRPRCHEDIPAAANKVIMTAYPELKPFAQNK